MIVSGFLLGAFYMVLFVGLLVLGCLVPESVWDKLEVLNENLDKKITRAFGETHELERDWE